MSAIEDMLLKFTSGNDVAVQRAVVTLDEWRATYAEYMALQARVAELEAKCAELVHYPGCWDTVAYPALQDALNNIDADYQGCTVCAEKREARIKAEAVREACKAARAEANGGTEYVKPTFAGGTFHGIMLVEHQANQIEGGA